VAPRRAAELADDDTDSQLETDDETESQLDTDVLLPMNDRFSREDAASLVDFLTMNWFT